MAVRRLVPLHEQTDGGMVPSGKGFVDLLSVQSAPRRLQVPYLSKDYVCRFLRANSACRNLFDKQLEITRPELFEETENHAAWRHADLFLAGFPRVGVKPGYDVLCHFTVRDSNRSSRLVGYVKGAPEMVPDLMDEAFIATREDHDERVPFHGTALEDQQILMIPQMPSRWAEGVREGGPAWLQHNINAVLTDDGTPEGVFERALLLIWSKEPVNRWHAVGFGEHVIQLTPVKPGKSFRPVDADGRRLDSGDAKGHQPLPKVWLPLVEQHLPRADLDGSKLPEDQRAGFEGKVCDMVRFHTFCEFGIRAYYEVTVWITEDVWHSEFRVMLAGEGGCIH